MRKIFIIIFIISIQNVFCEKTLLRNKILDYQCSLESDNLSGNVKEMLHYRQRVINENLDSLKLYRKKQYGVNKYLISEENYGDNMSKQVEYSQSFLYDDFNRVIKQVTYFWINKKSCSDVSYKYTEKQNRIEFFDIEDNLVEKRNRASVKYDIVGTVENDSLQNPIIENVIQNNDTSLTTSKYIYNCCGKYTTVFHQYKNKLGLNKYSEEYFYGQNQMITKEVLFDKNIVNYVREIKYDKNNLIEQLTEILKDSSVRITRFNDKALPLEKQFYKKGILQTDEFYQYKFDVNNNWIEKKVLSQDITKGEKKAKLTSIETRVITYFE